MHKITTAYVLFSSILDLNSIDESSISQNRNQLCSFSIHTKIESDSREKAGRTPEEHIIYNSYP